MIEPLLTTVDQIAVVLVAAVGLSSGASLLVLLADRPWRRHPDPEDGADLPTLISPRVMARRAGGDCAARSAGPGGAPDTVPTGLPRPVATGLPDDDTEQIARVDTQPLSLPPLVVDSPPSMLGTRPTVLDVPVVRLWSCGRCRDGRAVLTGDRCTWCRTARRTVAS